MRFTRPVYARLRGECLALPGVTEKAAWGHPTFLTKTRTFCAFEIFAGRPSVAFRLDGPGSRRFSRRKHFFATPYGRGVWVSRHLDVEIDWAELADLVERSYRAAAPKLPPRKRAK